MNKGELKELAIQSIINIGKMKAPLIHSSGKTLFHYLAENSNLSKKFFSQVEVDFKNNINIKDKNGLTPLFDAQDITTLKQLIAWNADLNATTNDGSTILHHATRYKNNSLEPSSELLEYLLENTTIKNLINKKNKENKTAFDLVVDNIVSNPAECAPYHEHINLLLQYGAEIGDAIETLKKIKNKPPMLDTMINFITNKKNQFSSSKPAPKPTTKPATANPLTKKLSKLNKELTNLRKKLKALAKNLDTLNSGLGVKNTTSSSNKHSHFEW